VIDPEVAEVLEGFVPLGDDGPTTQEVALGEAVVRMLADRDGDRPDVAPYLAMASTVELLDELRRRVLNEESA
jgi:hypothetical protein